MEKVVGKQSTNGRIQYKCKYKCYGPTRNNWEYFSNLYDCLDTVKQYEDSLLSPGVPPSTLFGKGWEAVTVLGSVDGETCVNRNKLHYLVLLKNKVTKKFMKTVLVPEECATGRKKVEELVKNFNDESQVGDPASQG